MNVHAISPADPMGSRSLTDQPLSSQALRRAFGKFPSGVVFLSAIVEGDPTGLVMSSFTSVSLEPPLVSLCVQSTSATWPRLRGAPAFGLSVFAEEHEPLCRQLSGRAATRFKDVVIEIGKQGEIFLPGAPLRMSCHLEASIPAGDHDIVLFQIDETSVLEGVMPLIFFDSKLGHRQR